MEVPDLQHFDEAPEKAVADARRTVQQADAPREGLGLLTDTEKIVDVLRRLFDEDSPTRELLDRLGELDTKE